MIQPTPEPVERIVARSTRGLDELMVRTANGDRDAFHDLYVTLGPRVKGYIGQVVRDPVASEEVLQDVMLTVWRRASTFDPRRAAATTWVYTIARNRSIDAVRRRKRPNPDPSDTDWVPATPVAADDVVSAEERAQRVRAALTALPAPQRQVLQLTFFESLSYPEIADELQVALGTVKSRARLGFQRLRRLLEST